MFIANSTRKSSPYKLLLRHCRAFASNKAELYRKCYEILKISSESDQETVRAAYISIVKVVHPDSGHPEASTEKFAEVDNAFRILQTKYAKERHGIRENPEVKECDIKHTAPQHRQYLSHDGVGYGAPAQRERQYQQSRASKAFGKVVEYRIDKISASDTELMKPGTFFKTHAIKTKYGFDRVVEDLIQEAMSKGEFDKLEGSGKPLSHTQSQNPYVDFTQHKINKILLENGFTPEWITLQKEIREDIDNLIEILTEYRSYLGEVPLNDVDMDEWTTVVSRQEHRETQINKKIDKYNLIVPILNQQMCRIQFKRIADKVLNSKPVKVKKQLSKTTNSVKHEDNSNKSLLSTLFWWT
ncbi:dnaJ homolog subfamily C member 28 [Sitodiplosis mosellana]|uniref:dnaJ homolog subfamily C member 28 n=1 Tax=Sitodiplosis mosellana TaxID=263140 RepID=UPI002445363B|nr:dnaJ homolog subfamily C member 28 [Sitodiplosis mosellana]